MRRKFATQKFLRSYGSFLEKHPELEAKTEKVMAQIVAGQTAGLRAHSLHGPPKGFHAARISDDYRLIFALESDAVTFIDIGSHDEVY